jgi:hypothetical protein
LRLNRNPERRIGDPWHAIALYSKAPGTCEEESKEITDYCCSNLFVFDMCSSNQGIPAVSSIPLKKGKLQYAHDSEYGQKRELSHRYTLFQKKRSFCMKKRLVYPSTKSSLFAKAPPYFALQNPFQPA